MRHERRSSFSPILGPRQLSLPGVKAPELHEVSAARGNQFRSPRAAVRAFPARAGRVNGEDVVQSVFRTFFRRCAQGEFQIDDSTRMWRLLVKITLQKARAQARHHTAEMRDVRAEAAGEDDAWLCEGVSREPGPL